MVRDSSSGCQFLSQCYCFSEVPGGFAQSPPAATTSRPRRQTQLPTISVDMRDAAKHVFHAKLTLPSGVVRLR